MNRCEHGGLARKCEPCELETHRKAIQDLLAWTATSGACGDCNPFREGPTAEFRHHKDCAHLKTINEAAALLGWTPFEGHDVEDVLSEMKRLADERWSRCWKEWREKAAKYDALVAVQHPQPNPVVTPPISEGDHDV